MNLEIFKKPDPSGSLYKEKILVKKHPEEYQYIIDNCINNNLSKDFQFCKVESIILDANIEIKK